MAPLARASRGSLSSGMLGALALAWLLFVSGVAGQGNSTYTAVVTLAGSGSQAWRDGQGTNASFTYPHGIVADSFGNLNVAEGVIRKITPGGMVSTLAGRQSASLLTNGIGSSATFYAPSGVLADK